MRRLLSSMILLVLLGLAVALPAGAENLGPGGGTRVIVGDQIVGPYRLLFTTSPEPAYSGTVTFVVRASDPQTGEKFKDLQVRIMLTDPASGAALTGEATHQNAGNAVDYAAHIPIDQAANWDGVLRVEGVPGAAEVKFVQRVLPKRGFNTMLLTGIPFVLLLAVLGVLWFRRGGRADAHEAGQA
jgi:hypothetical protein